MFYVLPLHDVTLSVMTKLVCLALIAVTINSHFSSAGFETMVIIITIIIITIIIIIIIIILIIIITPNNNNNNNKNHNNKNENNNRDMVFILRIEK